MPTFTSALLLLIILVGAAICLSGLVLIFKRPETETGAAKVEFFGQKLEANSKGIVVFLVGAGFLAAPLYLIAQRPETAVSSNSPKSAFQAAPAAKAAEAVLGAEVEDNDSAEKANLLALGNSVGGFISYEDEDWFAVDSGQGAAKVLMVGLRAKNHHYIRYDIFSSAGKTITANQSAQPTFEFKSYQVPQGISLIRVKTAHSSDNYELSVTAQ